MNVITIDLEMNKSVKKPIIQLGYTINNVKTGKLVMARSLFVNPNETIDPFITELTGIKDEDVADAGSLLFAYERMATDIKKHQTSPFVLQWGLDHFELRNQLNIDWDNYIFARRCIDIKSLYQAYAMARPQGKTVAGLAKACEVLGIEFEGRQHDALCDAFNTFKVFKVLTDKMVKYDEINKVVKK